MSWLKRYTPILLLAMLLPPFLSFLRAKSELYEDTDSLLLNVQLPRTRWMNMGYWEREAMAFDEAAAALARRLAAAVHLTAQTKLLDVGFGSGDSILLWSKEYAPAYITGVTSLAGQHAIALKAVAREGLQGVDLQIGDAAHLEQPPNHFDVVFALDTAYHFNTRQSFLSSAFDTLKPGGQLAMTDLVLSPQATPLDLLLLRFVCLVAKVPWTNMVSLDEYTARLYSNGFVDVQIDDISSAVFPGFLDFLARRDTSEISSIFNSKWRGLKMYGKVVGWWSGAGGSRPKLLFVQVYARKAS